jgi:hypothetical protein
MAKDWGSIAKKVDRAITKVADVSQPGGYPATIRRTVTVPDPDTPWDPSAGITTITYTVVRALVSDKELRDINGTLIGITKRTVTISGVAAIAPAQDDGIILGEALEFVDEADDASHAWQTIIAVRPLAPAGVAVLYDIDLQG